MTTLAFAPALDGDHADLAAVAASALSAKPSDPSLGAELGWFGIGVLEGAFADLAVIIEVAGATSAATAAGWSAGVVGPLLGSHALAGDVAGGTAIGVAIGQPSQLASILERGTGTMLAIGCPTGAAVAVPAIVDGAEVVTVVPADHPAVTVTPRVGIDPSRPLTDFRLDQFPAGDALATVPAAHTSWVTRVGLVAALDAAGAARTALSRTIAYAKERRQFGRPIGSFQAYKHRCADMFIELQLAHSIAFRAAGQIDSPLPLSAALLAPEAAVAVCGDAIQLHGGIGFTWEAGLHVHLKRARSDQIIAACSGATADALLAQRRSPSSPPTGPD